MVQLETFGGIGILPLRVQATDLATDGGVVEIRQGLRGVCHYTQDDIEGSLDMFSVKGVDKGQHACQGNSDEGFEELH
jgi:hypothetical protein